ncbi:hypothetical protein [Moraxella bovoculi]|nr:hypothetical protein [Moraxella bovoculi]
MSSYNELTFGQNHFFDADKAPELTSLRHEMLLANITPCQASSS